MRNIREHGHGRGHRSRQGAGRPRSAWDALKRPGRLTCSISCVRGGIRSSPGLRPRRSASVPSRPSSSSLVALQERQPLDPRHRGRSLDRHDIGRAAGGTVRRRGAAPRPDPVHLTAGLPAAVGRSLTREPDRAAAALGSTSVGGWWCRRSAGIRSDERLVTTILTRGEGNPFFLEELLRAVRDATAPTPAGIPETVHDLLSARILRLPDEERQILQLAAVIGREVPLALLEACPISRPAQIRASLAAASGGAAVSIRVGRDAAYTFSHALTWDVANEIMLEDERRALHARVVAGIERRYDAPLIDHVERLAEHAERGALWGPAIGYNTRVRAQGECSLGLSRGRHLPRRVRWLPSNTSRTVPRRLSRPSTCASSFAALCCRSGISLAHFQVLSELRSLTEELGDLRTQGSGVGADDRRSTSAWASSTWRPSTASGPGRSRCMRGRDHRRHRQLLDQRCVLLPRRQPAVDRVRAARRRHPSARA